MLEAFGTAISIQRYAQVAELVDAHGSGPCAFGCGGSSPLLGTKESKSQSTDWDFFMPFRAITHQNLNNINILGLFGWFFIVPYHPVSFLYIPFESVYINEYRRIYVFKKVATWANPQRKNH